MDSEDSSLHVGPPRHAASPHPTSPSAVSSRTKTKFTASSVVKDILCGRSTGMSAWITRTSAIFMRPSRRESLAPVQNALAVGGRDRPWSGPAAMRQYPCCPRGRQARSRSRGRRRGHAQKPGSDIPSRRERGGAGRLSRRLKGDRAAYGAAPRIGAREALLTRGANSGGPRRQSRAYRVVNHADERGDVEHRSAPWRPGCPRDTAACWCTRARWRRSPDARPRACARHRQMLLAGDLDVHLHLIVEHARA